MKICINTQLFIAKISNALFGCTLALMLAFGISSTRADETCSSPYLARIDGQEEFVYVWTLGVEGLGDGIDKLVTVDVKPGSPTTAKSSAAFRSRDGTKRITADSRTIVASSGWPVSIPARFSSSMSIPIRRNRSSSKRSTISPKQPAAPIGPHGAYALPGRVLIPCLSNAKDKGGRTALVEYGNDGNYIATHWMPTKDDS